MDLRFGMPVVDPDDHDAGKLDRLIVDRESLQVTNVIVQTTRDQTRLLSISEVQGSNDGRLMLYADSAALSQHPRYAESGAPSPAPAQNVDPDSVKGQTVGSGSSRPDGLPEGPVELSAETRVFTTDSGDGQLVGVGTTALTNGLAQLVLSRTGSPDYVVPIQMMGQLSSARIDLTADRSQMRPQDSAA